MDILKYPSFTLIIILYIISLVCSDVPAKGFGPSACSYYGSVDRCEGQTVVDINNIPTECMCIIFDGIFFDNINVIRYSYDENDDVHVRAILQANIPLYIYYGYQKSYNWTNAFKTQNNIWEIEEIQYYLLEHAVTGFILKNLFEDEYAITNDLSTKLQKYINSMHKDIPNLDFGLSIEASVIMKYSGGKCDTNGTSVDLKLLGEIFSFLIVTFDKFNKCSEPYRLGGTIPLDGKCGNTLTNLVPSLVDIPKEKLFFMFPLAPQEKNHQGPGCSPTYAEKCLKTIDNTTIKELCMDDLASYYLKGKFAKEHGGGFVGSNIDTNDPENVCKCEYAFASYHSIVNGYNGDEKLEPCILHDERP